MSPSRPRSLVRRPRRAGSSTEPTPNTNRLTRRAGSYDEPAQTTSRLMRRAGSRGAGSTSKRSANAAAVAAGLDLRCAVFDAFLEERKVEAADDERDEEHEE